MKPWVYSAQSGRKKPRDEKTEQPKFMILPNQLTEDDNKALGLGYTIDDDKLHVMSAVNFSKKKKDAPWRAFQEAKVKYCLEEDTWDAALSKELREDAIKLLEEYAVLSQLRFTRSLTPLDPCAQPIGITFSDGSEHAYGAVMYLRWSCSDCVVVRLESKAKLTPLDHKGDPVKAEMCGAVFAARLKNYFQRHCRIDVEKWFHLVDSQTVLGAIQRESYGYQTFFANRIGEIQSSTNVDDWWWIPGPVNIADIITEGQS
ncbi:hypothetical protein WMY93_009945 [Mugilogobius chulae]|uniref:Uncharacterized protein n=1 Tax=Mugilogobius chulae TaxID=88201 RepID=A0AAW0PBP0_9GOBI